MEEIKRDAEDRECEFVKRMIERAYADKRFEDAEVITELANGRRECNLHAASLVLRVISKQIGVIQ